MTEQSHAIAGQFLAALSAGALPDELLTDDMKAWTLSSGVWIERAQYQGGVRLLASVFDGPFTYTADAITAEDDRVAIEAHAKGRLVNGEDYSNSYVFILTLKDGRIATVAEHFNTLLMREKLAPLLQEAIARMKG